MVVVYLSATVTLYPLHKDFLGIGARIYCQTQSSV